MSYELGFSSEFFLAEGEPYDTNELALNKDGKPISVWSAICKLKEDKETWSSLANEMGLTDSDHLTEQMVLDKIRKTNTCSNLSVPVQVWVDARGWYTVLVWE